MPGGNRLTQLSGVKKGLGLGSQLPGVERQLGRMYSANVPNPAWFFKQPTTLFRGHSHPDPTVTSGEFGTAVHASPTLWGARRFSNIPIPGVGTGHYSLVSTFPARPGQLYHGEGQLVGYRGDTFGTPPIPKAPGKPFPTDEAGYPVRVSDNQAFFETDVAGVRPKSRYLVPHDWHAEDRAVAGIEVPWGRANDRFLQQIQRNAS